MCALLCRLFIERTRSNLREVCKNHNTHSIRERRSTIKQTTTVSPCNCTNLIAIDKAPRVAERALRSLDPRILLLSSLLPRQACTATFSTCATGLQRAQSRSEHHSFSASSLSRVTVRNSPRSTTGLTVDALPARRSDLATTAAVALYKQLLDTSAQRGRQINRIEPTSASCSTWEGRRR